MKEEKLRTWPKQWERLRLRLTRDDEEHKDDCRKKIPNEKKWRRRRDDDRPESGGDEMKMLREWGRGWGSVEREFVGVR